MWSLTICTEFGGGGQSGAYDLRRDIVRRRARLIIAPSFSLRAPRRLIYAPNSLDQQTKAPSCTPSKPHAPGLGGISRHPGPRQEELEGIRKHQANRGGNSAQSVSGPHAWALPDGLGFRTVRKLPGHERPPQAWAHPDALDEKNVRQNPGAEAGATSSRARQRARPGARPRRRRRPTRPARPSRPRDRARSCGRRR